MGILFPNWPAGAFVLPGVALGFVLAVIMAIMVISYLRLMIRYALRKRDGLLDDQQIDEANAFTYAWHEVIDRDWSGVGKVFAWFGAIFAIVLYIVGAVIAYHITWNDEIRATIGQHYDIVSTDPFHRTVTVDESGCYVTFHEYAYSDVLEEFIGSGEADLNRVGYDWEGNLESCFGIPSK